MTRAARGLWLALASTTACLGDFESSPAYEEQNFACGADQAEAWAEAVEACRSAFAKDKSSCGGVLSLNGKLAGDPVRSTTELDGSLFRILAAPEGPTLVRVDASGITPYFAATLFFDELGGAADDTPGPAREVSIVDELDLPMRQGDVRATFSLRASDGVSSRTFTGKEGTLRVSLQSKHEFAGSFEAHMSDQGHGEHAAGDEDELRGCFHIFAQKTRFEDP